MRMNLVVNRSLDGKFRKLEQLIQGYPEIYANEMAAQLVLYSPVDTGTFMDNFYAGASGTAGTGTSSHGKPRNQPWNGQEAINRMSRGIAAMRNSTRMVFGNSADHAYQVEYDHGYAPFRKAKSMHRSIAEKAERLAKARYL